MKSFGLSSNERIKSKKDFEDIYAKGDVLCSLKNRVRAIYIISKNADEPGVKIAPAVGKKLGNAVWRNRAKRLIRESYRTNKLSLLESCNRTNSSIKIVFSLIGINHKNYPKLYLKDLVEDIKEILTKLETKLR